MKSVLIVLTFVSVAAIADEHNFTANASTQAYQTPGLESPAESVREAVNVWDYERANREAVGVGHKSQYQPSPQAVKRHHATGTYTQGYTLDDTKGNEY